MSRKNIENLESKKFRKFGRVIEYPGYARKGKKRNLWKIIHTSETQEGWRIAYLVLRDKSISRLQCHPNTDETFEPLQGGKAVLFASTQKDLSKIQAFWLDRPVVIYQGVWHGIIAPGDEAHLKIFENNHVECENFLLGFRLNLEGYLSNLAI